MKILCTLVLALGLSACAMDGSFKNPYEMTLEEWCLNQQLFTNFTGTLIDPNGFVIPVNDVDCSLLKD